MTHIRPRTRDELPELKEFFALIEAGMGFVPESMLTMAHWPELLQAFTGLSGTILGGGELDPGLKQLVAFVTSNAAGCRYCQAHSSHSATRRGVSLDKIDAAFEFETSDLFTAAEKAALRVALHAGLVPNAVTAEQMAELSAHYDERQVVELVAVIALFGYLNRWNDTMASTLEDEARDFAGEHLRERGWQPGKHAG
jgi:uncharacterized peroxidase-related enzyme